MMSTQHPNPERLMRWATYASVSTALFLIITKLIAWFVTDSVSILATLIDSSLDMLASIVNLIAVRHALQPADKEHRFGHGKAEALAGMGQSMFIAGSAGVLLLQALERFFNPKEVMTNIDTGLAVMVFSMLMTLLLITFQNYVIKHTDSTAIKADALHYKTDLWVNGSVIFALLSAFYGYAYFDAFIALGIAIFVLYSAWEIVKESIDLLMDHELPNQQRNEIIAVITSNLGVIGYHDLRTRRSGTMVFIQFHLELDATLSLLEAHTIAEGVEEQLNELFQHVEVIIHEDPVTMTK
jgi:ferrous-iron efflux pump FieF